MFLLICRCHNSINSRHRRISSLETTYNHPPPPTKGKLTERCFLINFENLNMAGQNDLHPSLPTRYLIMLKSPNKHHAKFHHNLTLSSSAHMASQRLSTAVPYTPEQTHSKPSTAHFNRMKLKNYLLHSKLSQPPFYPTSKESPLV